MFGNDVLDRFDRRRRFWRRVVIAIAAILNICLLSGIAALMILMWGGRSLNFETRARRIPASSASPSAPSQQIEVQSAEAKPEIGLIEPNQAVPSPSQNSALTRLPPMQSVLINPAVPSAKIPEQVATDHEPASEAEKTNSTSVANVPMPRARPDRHVIERAGNYAKTAESDNKTKNAITNREGRVNQAEAPKPPSNTEQHGPKASGIDARRTLALDLEQSYTSSGVSISTHVSGSNGTVLNIQYSRFDDALVQKILSVKSFAAMLGKVGFTKIIFAGSQDKTWTFPLQPPSQSDKASPGAAAIKPSP